MIDDISPFAIMGNQTETIEQSNVDDSVGEKSSTHAWGDKSTPLVRSTDTDAEEEDIQTKCSEDGDISGETESNAKESKDCPRSGKTYAISKDDKPINLMECCLCCFRIQSYEEVLSLYSHIKIKHQTSRVCAVCNIKFPDVYKLMLHVVEFHRGTKSLRCRKCKKKFQYHDELKKHVDYCFLSDISDNEMDDEVEASPTKSPKNKKQKFDNSATGIAQLVSTMKNTQNTLDKINELINLEPSRFE